MRAWTTETSLMSMKTKTRRTRGSSRTRRVGRMMVERCQNTGSIVLGGSCRPELSRRLLEQCRMATSR